MEKGNSWQMFAILSTLGTEIVILTVGGGWLGNYLDLVWHTKPIILYSGIFLGLGLGFTSAVYIFKAFTKDGF
jgi:ATP synthase protein I